MTSEPQKLVLTYSDERLLNRLDKIESRLTKIETMLAAQRVRVSLFGLIAGAIAAVPATLIALFK